ncbi:MAG: universal stress protein [Planctomycetota bacterium]|jgi:nucleotide-binding universal stress UspA family protein
MSAILVGIDFSPLNDAVLDVAERLATATGRGLFLVHVAAPDPEFVGYEVGPQAIREVRANELLAERDRMKQMADALESRGVTAYTRLVAGETVNTLLDEADSHGADMIIVGSHGHGAIHRALLGSIAEGLLRHTKLPLLIVPAPRPD